jgi:hypothetical protein
VRGRRDGLLIFEAVVLRVVVLVLVLVVKRAVLSSPTSLPLAIARRQIRKKAYRTITRFLKALAFSSRRDGIVLCLRLLVKGVLALIGSGFVWAAACRGTLGVRIREVGGRGHDVGWQKRGDKEERNGRAAEGGVYGEERALKVL